MNTGTVCHACSGPIQEGQRWCDRCGRMVEGTAGSTAEIQCETHPNQRAIGLCCVCDRPVCSDCSIKSEGKIFCTGPEHRTYFREWCVVCQTDSEFDADALVRNLADSGIEARMFSLHDYIAAHGLDEARVRVWVRRDVSEQAQTLLQDLHLTGGEGSATADP